MQDMTAANLRSAFGGESMAHLRYLVWAKKAQDEGFVNVARLFRAISRAEEAHASGHFRAMKDVAGEFSVTAGAGFGLGTTSENLAGAIAGELFEVNQMYPAYMAVAEAQSETAALKSMSYALEAEKTHAGMFEQAKSSVDAGKDYQVGTIRVCSLCGHTLEGDPPQRCPVCGVAAKMFVAFE